MTEWYTGGDDMPKPKPQKIDGVSMAKYPKIAEYIKRLNKEKSK